MSRLFHWSVLLSVSVLLAACSDNNDSGPVPAYDFSAADAWLQAFVAEEPAFDGAGFIVVDAEHGIVHERAFGAHTTETIYLLASVSKVPSVSLLMALADDPALEFDIDTPIESYLPWHGVYPGRTTAHLLSNTSGIPGLLAGLTGDYGVHTCQYAAAGQFPESDTLAECAQAIYQTPLQNTVAPGTLFDYGGSQWQLAGAVAEAVGGDSWANLFRRYVAEPCGLEVFEYGNLFADNSVWTGFPDSLVGRDNPNIEGGAISGLRDVARLLRMHLNDGVCGDTRVMSEQLAQRMREDVGTALGSREWIGSNGRGYGLGWWIPPAEEVQAPTLFQDGGAYGSVSYIDTARRFGVFVALAKYDDLLAARRGPNRIIPELTPIIEGIIDGAK